MITFYVNKGSLFLILSIFLVRCSEPKIQLPDYTPKIAVDAIIEAGRPPVMYLTFSSPFISEYDSMDFVEMVKFNVSAYVITEEDDTIGFTRRTNSSEFPPFKYSMSISDLVGEAGKTYKLLIRKAGIDDITAITHIPENPPKVMSLLFIRDTLLIELGYYELQIENTKEPFFCFVENKEFGEAAYYPIRFPAKSNRLYSGDVLAYSLQSAGNSNLWLSEQAKDSLVSGDAYYNKNGLFHFDDRVLFKISSVDVDSYEVLASMFLDAEFPDNPFKPISQLPISNVSNGIGRWTGMNSVELVAGK